MVVKTFYQVVELAFSWFLLNVFHVANHVGMAPGSFDPRDGRVRAMTFWFDEATLTAEEPAAIEASPASLARPSWERFVHEGWLLIINK